MTHNYKIQALSFLLLILLGSRPCRAQEFMWNWYFGYNCALNFSTGVPVTVSGSAMSQYEGCSSISDANGNLLFYTDGLSVWNKNNQLMPNGTGMLGDPSSTQSALIVSKPGSSTIYYIFVTSGYDSHYSEVDMTLQGGLGDVTANKNILLSSNSAEKLAGTMASNGTDVWVATHDNSSQTFKAYLVTSNGVNVTAVLSSVGNILGGNIGQLQFSPDGKKAAMASYSAPNSETVELYHFDNATGIFSDHIGLATTYFQTYGLEFSPNSQILYSGANPDNTVQQWDISVWDQATIHASQTQVGINSYTTGSLELAADGKIYVAQQNATYAGCINNPDVLGVGCNYVATQVNLAPKTMGLGLPNLVNGSDNPIPPSFAASDTQVCAKFCINFYDSSQNNPTAWLWYFPGGTPDSSIDQNPMNICYNVGGVYDVTLITTNAGGNDTLTLPGYITVLTNPFAPIITQVGNVLTSSPAYSYQWQYSQVDIPGATNQSYTISQSGLYTVIISNEDGCNAQADIDASYTGIESPSGNEGFNIFPNPAAGNVTIQLTNCCGQPGARVAMLNALGQVLLESDENTLSGNHPISLSTAGLAAGVYFVELTTSDGRLRKKLIITN